jgi:hypothetical protein
MNEQEILDRAKRAAMNVDGPDQPYDALLRRHDRKRRNQRIAAGVVGIAVFVAAVWVVMSGAWWDRTQTSVAPRPAGKGPVQTAPPPAPASAAPSHWVTNGTCSYNAETQLELTELNHEIGVRFELHRGRWDTEWSIVLRHTQNLQRGGVVIFRGTRRLHFPEGIVVVRDVQDYPFGLDGFRAKAVGSGGQVCRVYAEI